MVYRHSHNWWEMGWIRKRAGRGAELSESLQKMKRWRGGKYCGTSASSNKSRAGPGEDTGEDPRRFAVVWRWRILVCIQYSPPWLRPHSPDSRHHSLYRIIFSQRPCRQVFHAFFGHLEVSNNAYLCSINWSDVQNNTTDYWVFQEGGQCFCNEDVVWRIAI